MTDFYESDGAWHIQFGEPHKDGRHYISRSRLIQVKMSGKKLICHYKGEKYMFSIKEWMDEAKPMSKEFKIKGCPMKLWGQVLSKGNQPQKPEDISVIHHLDKIPDKYRQQIKAFLSR